MFTEETKSTAFTTQFFIRWRQWECWATAIKWALLKLSTTSSKLWRKLVTICSENAISDGLTHTSPSRILHFSWKYSMTINGFRCLAVEWFTISFLKKVEGLISGGGPQDWAYSVLLWNCSKFQMWGSSGRMTIASSLSSARERSASSRSLASIPFATRIFLFGWHRTTTPTTYSKSFARLAVISSKTWNRQWPTKTPKAAELPRATAYPSVLSNAPSRTAKSQTTRWRCGTKLGRTWGRRPWDDDGEMFIWWGL